MTVLYYRRAVFDIDGHIDLDQRRDDRFRRLEVGGLVEWQVPTAILHCGCSGVRI